MPLPCNATLTPVNGGGKEGHWGGGMVYHREGASWLGRESWWQNQGMEPGLVLTVPYASPWSSGGVFSLLRLRH